MSVLTETEQRDTGTIFFLAPDVLKPLALGFEVPTSQEDYDRLKQDIEKHGIREPLVVWKTRVVCGNTRLRIAHELGLNLVPVRYLPDSMDELEVQRYALMDNLARRHLNSAQKAELAARIEEIEARLAEKRMKLGKKQDPVYSEYTGSTGRARDIACKQAGISPDTLHKAKFIRKENPELWQQCLQGTKSIKEAYKEAKRVNFRDIAEAQREADRQACKELKDYEKARKLVYELSALCDRIDPIFRLIEAMEQAVREHGIKPDELREYLPECIEKLRILGRALLRLEHILGKEFKLNELQRFCQNVKTQVEEYHNQLEQNLHKHTREEIRSAAIIVAELTGSVKDLGEILADHYLVDHKTITQNQTQIETSPGNPSPNNHGELYIYYSRPKELTGSINSNEVEPIEKWWPEWCEEVCIMDHPEFWKLCKRADPCPKEKRALNI